MRHGSLFSGIGGFDLAAQWMGWQNVFHCEWNPFGQRILKYYWPNAISYHDITKTDFTIHRGGIDIITGGFPCQPYSTAGKRLGKADERHLFPEMLRAIKEIKPRWVVGENVRGLVSWNGGMVFHEVCADLEGEGYEVIPFLIPAAGVNAPHRRDRVWFVAKNASSNGCIFRQPKQEGAEVWEQRDIGAGDTERIRGEAMAGIASNTTSNGCTNGRESATRQEREGERGGMQQPAGMGSKWNASNTDSIRLEYGKERGEVGDRSEEIRGTRSEPTNAIKTNGEVQHAANTNGKMLEQWDGKGTARERAKQEKRIKSFNGTGGWKNFPTVSPLCNGDDGLSDRLDGITFSKWRNESIKGGGNAVVPQVILQIFKAIEAYEHI